MFSIGGRVRAQASNTTPWPNDPPVGIGTHRSFGPALINPLQIHYDPTLIPNPTLPAMIRLSEGDSTNMQTFGLLGLMPTGTTTYSSLSTGDDLILHEHQGGDIIITNYSTINAAFANGTAIRLATTSDSAHRPLTPPTPHDLERMTIDHNGNIGFDLQPDPTTGLGTPLDQVQIGGGVVPPLGYTAAVPGLTMYGGNRFENILSASGVIFPYDWRYIGFNQYTNHADTSSARHKRIAPMSSSVIAFAANDNTNDGGMIDLHCMPYDSTTGLNDDTAHGINLHLMGSKGLEMWCDVSQADPYHGIFEAYRPGYLPSPITRNTNGLFYHHTPVYIGSDTGGQPLVDFTNLTNVRPNIGDDSTWMLAVNGAALFKEAWVNSSDWPDYVFLPDFKLMSITDFGNYIKTNHHLPELPAAKTMNACVPLGQTEKELTKQVEEMALYIDQLNKEVEALKADIQDLKKGGK
jgi:hypothetical protein